MLIANKDHQYVVQSTVCDDVFQSFVDYLVNDKLPDIQIHNINEYIELSIEFNILQNEIESKKKEFGEYFVNLNGFFVNRAGQNLSYYEEQIAIKLDEYLDKCSNELMKIKINSLYNIFNHKNRKLENHNLAYNIICQHFNATKDSNIFILLDSLDGTKLTKKNIDESMLLYKERSNHMPFIDFSYISNVFQKQEKLEKQVCDLINEFNEYKTQNEIEKKEMHDEIVACKKENQKMQQKHDADIEACKKENQKMQQKHDADIEACKKENQKMQQKHDADIEAYKKENQKMQQKHDAEIEACKKENQKIQQKHDADIEACKKENQKIQQKHDADIEACKKENQKIQQKHDADIEACKKENQKMQQKHDADIEACKKENQKMQQKHDAEIEACKKENQKIQQKHDADIEACKKENQKMQQRYNSGIETCTKENRKMQQKYDGEIEACKKENRKIQQKHDVDIESCKKENQKMQQRYNSDIENLKSKVVQNQSIIIKSIEERFVQSFSAELGLKTNGILYQLKMKEKTLFDRLFIASQSSRDIYNLIDPNTKDDFRTSKNKNTTINFELKESISINGIKIFSSTEYFPKSFDIAIDDKVVKSIESADQLNGENKEMAIKFDSVKGKKISFIQKGMNWDTGKYRLLLKKFEILSDEPQYSDGVFSTLIKLSQNNDPHKCPVYSSSTSFDLNQFINIDSSTNICTYRRVNSWFQIEFLFGIVILTGFRIKKQSSQKLKSYKVICTDDVNKEEELWISLIEINEKFEYEHNILDVYKFQNPSPPVKFVRLVQTGPNWDDDFYLTFDHFDLFGKYF